MIQTSTEFVDQVESELRSALDSLNRHQVEFEATTPVLGERDRAWDATFGRLEGNLTEWQSLLGDMADRARLAQDELNALDVDLNQSLTAFAAARKYLQA